MSLVIDSLKKSFDGKCVIDGFSYAFPESGIFAVMGRSGVGKTTLLRLISGLDTSFSGRIVGGGTKNTSVAFQEYRLFPTLTALDNAALGASTQDSTGRAKELLIALGFTEDELYLMPDELSGGMKQRVSLVRALLRETPILLLDEPTKELNEELAAKVLKLITELSKKRLVIFVTHKPEDAIITNSTVITLE